MSEKELRQSVEQLHAEIERLAGVDETSRARLAALVADLEGRIDDPDDEEGRQRFVEEVREAIMEFEVEHPTATGILNHVMVTLANMGI